jgi:hypothetical protein
LGFITIAHASGPQPTGAKRCAAKLRAFFDDVDFEIDADGRVVGGNTPNVRTGFIVPNARTDAGVLSLGCYARDCVYGPRRAMLPEFNDN